jgi:hypothetical protein
MLSSKLLGAPTTAKTLGVLGILTLPNRYLSDNKHLTLSATIWSFSNIHVGCCEIRKEKYVGD